MATPTNPPFNPLAEVALEPDLWGWPRWLRELIRVFNGQAHRQFWVRELIFSAKSRPRTDVVQRGLVAVLFFNFVNMASSAKSFVRTQTNSRYAETRVPSSEKLTRISEELELRKPSIDVVIARFRDMVSLVFIWRRYDNFMQNFNN